MELLGKSKNELRDFCVGLGEPGYRGGQIYHALYAERKSSVREISNLPAGLRERLGSESTITWPAVRQTYASQDGSVGYLFGCGDSGANFDSARATQGATGAANQPGADGAGRAAAEF